MSWQGRLSYLKNHPRKIALIIFGIISIFGIIFLFLLRQQIKQRDSVAGVTNEALTEIEISSPDEELEVLQAPITILLLGLDSRRGDAKPRCDAVHLVTFSPPEEKIIITSVPRGIHVDIKDVATPSAYLANLCEHQGIEAAVREIIRITGLNPDHIIKINFSQTLGILRLMGMPTTPTLQFLRDRRSYLRGDYQRSHNQALFLKDLILYHTEQAADLPMAMKRIIFKMVDTGDLDFDTANLILNWVVKNGIWQRPEKIELVIKPKPFYKLTDIHFSATDYPSEDTWQNDEEFQAYQKELKTYLEGLCQQGEKYLSNGQKQSAYYLLKTPYSQQLWLQIEDEELRNELHFDLLRIYALALEDKEEARDLVRDFIEEMEATMETELKEKAEELLTYFP